MKKIVLFLFVLTLVQAISFSSFVRPARAACIYQTICNCTGPGDCSTTCTINGNTTACVIGVHTCTEFNGCIGVTTNGISDCCATVCNYENVGECCCGGTCTPNCTGKVCGESDGCGGTCPNTGASNWSTTGCGACNQNPGGCGNVTLTQSCNQSNQCGGTRSITQNCGSACNECGPTYAAWGACTAPTFSRSRDYTMNCSAGGTQTETCYGTITGTFFDASLVDTCATYASQNKIATVPVTLTATTNHSTAYATTTDTNGLYSRGALLVPDNYNLTFTIPDGVRYIDNPPKLLCDGALTNIALTTQAQTVTRRVGLWRVYGGWFQTQGGGIYGSGGITVTIPATCSLAGNMTSCNSYTSGTVKTPLIVADANGSVGTAYAGDGNSVSLGGGGSPASNAVVSSSNFQAGSGNADRAQGYNYFIKQGAQYQNTTKTAWNGAEGKPTGASNGLYQTNFTGTLTIGTPTQPGAGENYVIFHDGDVSIVSDIDVPVGSFFGVIATGSIRVQPAVTRAEGVYIADQNFEVLSSGDENTEVRFVGEGSFVGLSGISLLRTRGVTNNSESSEFFIFRPDFVVNSPYGLRLPQYTWREVAP